MSASLNSPRPAYTRRSTSSASFQGQLKNLQRDASLQFLEFFSSEPVIEFVNLSDGTTVKVTHSDTKYTILSSTSVKVPSGVSDAQDIVATLFFMGDAKDGDNAKVSESAILEFVQIIVGLTVPFISPETSYRFLSSDRRVVEISFSMPAQVLPLADLRHHEELHDFSSKWSVDIVLQHNDVFRRHKRLVVFDMDSTLIEQEVIDEVAAFVGVKEEVSAITARSMAGELDFAQSLIHRAALLKGVPASVWEQFKADGKITFTPGARDLCRALKILGFKTAVVSGGFTPLAAWVQSELCLDYAFANQLAVSADGLELTGEVEGTIVTADLKAELLERIAEECGIRLEQTVAVGDGANDLKMMHKAGLGIAFNAKEAVQIAAPCQLNSKSLTDVLYVFGLSDKEQAALGCGT